MNDEQAKELGDSIMALADAVGRIADALSTDDSLDYVFGRGLDKIANAICHKEKYER